MVEIGEGRLKGTIGNMDGGICSTNCLFLEEYIYFLTDVARSKFRIS